MTCSASSEYQNGNFPCRNVLDDDESTEWATHQQGKGAWINVDFNKAIHISKIRLRQRLSGGRFKRIKLDFSNGYNIKTKLQYLNTAWNNITIESHVTAASVNITAETVYGADDSSGFSAAQFFGCG